MGREFPGRQLRTSEGGGSAAGKTKRGKGTNGVRKIEGKGLPMGVWLESASPSEVRFVEPTVAVKSAVSLLSSERRAE